MYLVVLEDVVIKSMNRSTNELNEGMWVMHVLICLSYSTAHLAKGLLESTTPTFVYRFMCGASAKGESTHIVLIVRGGMQ